MTTIDQRVVLEAMAVSASRQLGTRVDVSFDVDFMDAKFTISYRSSGKDVVCNLLVPSLVVEQLCRRLGAALDMYDLKHAAPIHKVHRAIRAAVDETTGQWLLGQARRHTSSWKLELRPVPRPVKKPPEQDVYGIIFAVQQP